MKDDSLPTWLYLRLLVGYLGERAQGAWWPTAFYEPSGRLFLEPVFGKTARLAQYHGVLEAARRLHDDHLSVGRYHLFRLPEEVEQNLHGLIERQVREAATPPVPQNLPGGDGAATLPGLGEFVLEPKLRAIMEQALAANRTLRRAALDIEAARAQYRIQRAAALPTLCATCCSKKAWPCSWSSIARRMAWKPRFWSTPAT